MKDITVKTGSSVRCDCQDCESEWEITLEPKFAEMDYEEAKRQGAGVRHIHFCPLCGSTNIIET